MDAYSRKLLPQSLPSLQPTTAPPAPPSGVPLTSAPNPDSFQSSVVLALLASALMLLFLIGCVYQCMFGDFVDPESELARRRHRRGPQGASLSNLRKDVDPLTIRSLPVYSYCRNEKYQMDCPICLSEFEEGEAVKAIPFCKHVFHPECIDTWLSSHVSCPVCRSAQLFDEVKGGPDISGLKDAEWCDNCVCESSCGRSTAGNHEVCIEVRVVGPFSFGVRRNSSCSSLADRAGLQRTSSF